MTERTKCSFNMIACHKYDEGASNIEGVFNSITLGDERTLTFDLLTFIYLLNKEYEKLTIVYCIYNVEKGANSAKVISKSELHPKKGIKGAGGRPRKTSAENLSAAIRTLHISNMKFTEKGDYEIRAYVFWDADCENIVCKEAKEIDVSELVKKVDNLEAIVNIEIA